MFSDTIIIEDEVGGIFVKLKISSIKSIKKKDSKTIEFFLKKNRESTVTFFTVKERNRIFNEIKLSLK